MNSRSNGPNRVVHHLESAKAESLSSSLGNDQTERELTAEQDSAAGNGNYNLLFGATPTPEDGNNGKLVSVRQDATDALVTVQTADKTVGISTLMLCEDDICMAMFHNKAPNHSIAQSEEFINQLSHEKISHIDLESHTFNGSGLKTQESSPEQFFTKMLRNVDTPALPYGLSDIHDDGMEVDKARLLLPKRLNDRLRGHAQRLGVSLASISHLAWAQVISRTSGQEQVVFGT
ncbi:hypothetical protein BGX27_000626, partial [Mortierella sp. AM989]